MKKTYPSYKMFFYIGVMLVFLTYLYFANTLFIHLLSNNAILKSCNAINSGSPTAFSLDRFEIINDFLDNIYFKGWIRGQDWFDNNSVQIVFKGQNMCYSAPITINRRTDVTPALRERSVSGYATGFNDIFSTLHLKEDIYDTYKKQLVWVVKLKSPKGDEF